MLFMYRFIFLLAIVLSCWATAQGTLEQIKTRGKLICGINASPTSFISEDQQNNLNGFNSDFCRAIAAAALGDANAVTLQSLSTQDRFAALTNGEIDVLISNTTWTSARDSQLVINFAPIILYDSQGIMVTKESGVATLADLNGRSICFLSNTTTEINLADVMVASGLTYTPLALNNIDEILAAYQEGQCEAWSTDKLSLFLYRQYLANPDQHEILSEKLSKEPLAPAVRQGDDIWFDIVKWTIFSTFLAEEHGINSSNVAQMAKESDSIDVLRLLGTEPTYVEQLKLESDAFYNVISQVGNYAEIYKRHWEPLGIPRGLNNLYTEDGGLLYAPPIR